jgi:light-regulated signal transduction histidine kinase (bacteriophytochrome)
MSESSSTKTISDQKNAAMVHLERINEKIMHNWEIEIRKVITGASERTQLVLNNQLPELLENIGKVLSPANADFNFSKAAEIGKKHGEQRAGIVDYTLSQILREFRVLRQTVFTVLDEEKIHAPEVRNTILNVIDESLQKAVEQFTVIRSRELEQSNKDLEHFAAIAAHDLKSPLATISGYMEILDENMGPKADLDDAEYIKTVKRLAAQMTLLIDRLLEYSVIGRKLGLFTTLDTNQIVQNVLEGLSLLIIKSQAKITFHELPQIKGESSLLTQLFQNLIANSIKFRDGTRPLEISITAKEDETHWIFSVKDNGLGFNPAEKDDVFTLFSKAHSKKSHRGYGIGLATVRKIVELHGGKIWAESVPGVGATFLFSLEK